MASIRQTAIGVDPGARWTAAVLRDETRVITGGTIGPRNAAGEVEPSRIEDVFSEPAKFVGAVRRYTVQICELVDQLAAIAEEATGRPPLLGIERYTYAPRKAAGVSWMVPLLIVQGLAVRYPHAKLVAPAEVGSSSDYPKALRGKHPDGWLRRDEPSNRRGHEQSAWDVAGEVLTATGGVR